MRSCALVRTVRLHGMVAVFITKRSNTDMEALLAPFGAERDKDGWAIPYQVADC